MSGWPNSPRGEYRKHGLAPAAIPTLAWLTGEDEREKVLNVLAKFCILFWTTN